VKCQKPQNKLDIFLRESKPLIETLLTTIAREGNAVAEAEAKVKSAEQKADCYAQIFESAELSEDYAPSSLNHHHGQMAEAYGELQLVRTTHKLSLALAAASLLQVAKQALSFAAGKPCECAPGRVFGATNLRDVIVEGRNQALHFEENAPRKGVTAVFAALEQGFGPRFRLQLAQPECLAPEVVELLGWRSFDDVKKDLMSLSP
jgi:hypothetical protein